MKTSTFLITSCLCACGFLYEAAAQTAAQTLPAPDTLAPAQTNPAAGAPAAQTGPDSTGDAVTANEGSDASSTPAPAPAATVRSRNGNGELRLNFRNAPLETVLNYLSEAAGFIIDLRTELKGKITVWSNQPVSKEEALDLLNSALDKNGYAALRKGRTLTILNKDDAKKQDLPVRTGNRPEDIPKNDEMVTQIIPVRFINAVQVSRDLRDLLPEKATMTANEGGNAILITDTQVNIRRMTEIIKALDTAISSVSSVRVFPLKFADAKALASVIKDLFAPQETSRATGGNQGGAGRFFNQFRGGGGFPGAAGAAAANGSASSNGRAPTPRVVAVAEERSNSVVVSAPEEQMPLIEDLIVQVDTSVEDITELRVFRLKFADAQETADLLSDLFSDTASGSTSQGGRGQIRFGGRFGGFTPFRNAAANSTGESARLEKQTKVVAVPDLRTGSVVVSASRDLMTQIGKMIEDLDSDPAKKQQVFVFDVQNTDPQSVQDILQSLFPAPTYGNTANSRYGNTRNQNGVGSQLSNRATQNQNQGGTRIGNTGATGFGGGSSFGTGR